MTEELSLALPRSVAPPGVTRETSIDLTALVDNYSAILYRVAHAILRNQQEAEDAVQDTFVRVLQHTHDLPAVRDLRPWLIRITWNLALDRRRRIRPTQMDEAYTQSLISPDTPADIALRESQQIQTTLREIDRLPKPERQALLLSALEELSTAEIGNIMNKSESAIRALLYRARTRLRTRLVGFETKVGHA